MDMHVDSNWPRATQAISCKGTAFFRKEQAIVKVSEGVGSSLGRAECASEDCASEESSRWSGSYGSTTTSCPATTTSSPSCSESTDTMANFSCWLQHRHHG